MPERLGIGRERLFKLGADIGQAVTLVTLLNATPGVFESPKFFGKNFRPASAAELNIPEEQDVRGLPVVPTPTPKPELPRSIANTKFIYVTEIDGRRTLYQADLEKKENLSLVGPEANPKSADWRDKDTLVYSSARGTIYYPWSGIRTRNLKTGKDEWLFDDEKREESLDSCPAVDSKGNVSFIRHNMKSVNFSDTVTTLDKKSRALRTLTRGDGEANNCLHFSPDGRLVAFRSGYAAVDAGSGEIQVYSTETLEENYLNQKPLYRIPGIDVFDWSPDGSKLLIRRVVRLGKRDFSDRGYSFDLKSGKEELIGGGFLSAIWSADGTWMLASVRTGQKGTAVRGYKQGLTSSVTILESAGEITSLRRYPERRLIPKRKFVEFVLGLTTEIVGGEVSLETSGLTDELQTYLINYGGFRREDFARNSPRGMYYDEKTKRWLSRSSDCEDSLSEHKWRAKAFADHIVDLQNTTPDKDPVFVTHSDGANVVIMAFQILKERGINLRSGIKIIFTHSAGRGVEESVIDIYNRLWKDWSSDACKIFWDSQPQPSLLNWDAGKKLLEYGKNYTAREKEIADIVTWMKDQGVEVYALINFQDCAISLNICLIPPEVQEVLFMLHPERLRAMMSQEIPGAVNIGRFLGGITQGFGHDRYFKSEEGLAILKEIIGKQVSD